MNAAKRAEKKARNTSRISIGKAMTIGHHLAMIVHATIDREMIEDLARRAPVASIGAQVVEAVGRGAKTNRSRTRIDRMNTMLQPKRGSSFLF